MTKKVDVALDIEADSLTPTKIHLVCAKVIGEDRWLICREPSDLQKAIPYFNKVAVHNSFGFDLPALRRLWGIPFTVEPDTWDGHEVEWVDTFQLSSYLNADRPGGHSLDNLSGGEKMNFRQACIDAGLIQPDAPEGAEFSEYSETMLNYCRKDVECLEKVYLKLMKEAQEKYGE